MLDLVYCAVSPVFLATCISLFLYGPASAVYYIVMLMKGFHLAMLLLPAARHAGAHTKHRWAVTDSLEATDTAGAVDDTCCTMVGVATAAKSAQNSTCSFCASLHAAKHDTCCTMRAQQQYRILLHSHAVMIEEYEHVGHACL